MSTCNPGGPCIAFLDAQERGYVDPIWEAHLLTHALEAERAETDTPMTVTVDLEGTPTLVGWEKE